MQYTETPEGLRHAADDAASHAFLLEQGSAFGLAALYEQAAERLLYRADQMEEAERRVLERVQ